MKKVKSKKLDFKKISVVELDSKQLIKLVGGSGSEMVTDNPLDGPKIGYSRYGCINELV